MDSKAAAPDQRALFVSPRDAFTRHITTATGQRRTKLEYVPSPGSEMTGPQAFLVTVPPDGVVPPHFHTVNQFQVFFGVPGATYKGHPLADCVVHYADAYSTYGPYRAAAQQVEFFTLRPTFTSYVGYMPEKRADKIKKSGRNIHVDIGRRAIENVPPPGGLATDTLIRPHPDGLRADLVRIGPGRGWAMTQVDASSAGRYNVVLWGNLVHDGRMYGARSVIWSGSTAGPVETAADRSAGCVLLSLEFPQTRL
jgi:hypothetical protein